MVSHDKYANSPRRAYAQEINDLGDDASDISLALLADSYTPDLIEDETFADVSGDEITATDNNDDGYPQSGQEIGNISLLQDGSVTTFDGDDVVFDDSTITASFAVIYDRTPADEVDQSLLTLIDFEGEEISEDGDFRIEFDAEGIFEVETQP